MRSKFSLNTKSHECWRGLLKLAKKPSINIRRHINRKPVSKKTINCNSQMIVLSLIRR